MCATAAVVVSTVIGVLLSSLAGQAGAPRQGTSGVDIAEYAFVFPSATGWLIVATVFGGWRAVHQGQIALVPVFRVVVDAVIIFPVWEFWHRKNSKELNSNGTLGLNG
jgi:ABC-type dipeptide/oligopeptide/nickel transport system permease subunit